MDVENFLHHGVSGGAPLQVGVVGRIPADWGGAGQNSPLGDTADYRLYATSERISYVDIPSLGASKDRGKPAKDRKLFHPSPKICRVKYCDKENYGPMSDGVSESGKQISKRY